MSSTVFPLGLAFKSMIVECPRCGFAQPKDQFCANCGVNMESFAAKPKPLVLRILQNPNLHLTLILVLIVLVIGYILKSQSSLVSKEMGRLLDLPVSSRDAGDPDDVPKAKAPAKKSFSRPTNPEEAPAANAHLATAEPTATSDGESGDKSAGAEAAKLTATSKLEVTHWEVPREAIANLLPLGEKVGESNAGRAYLFANGSKVAEQLQNVGQKLSTGRSIAVKSGGQLTVETPPTTGEAFQYGLLVQIVKAEGKDVGFKWDSQLVLPQQETAAEAASSTPALRSTIESNMTGSTTVTTAGLVLIVMEPTHRTPREEFLARAGEGPWSIFSSQEFRGGLTEWVISVQVK